MNQHQYLEVGQDVVFVGPDKKSNRGKITIIYGPDDVRIEWGNGSAVAKFSDSKEPGTFHFEQASPKAESGK
jgi:hypothetical protein